MVWTLWSMGQPGLSRWLGERVGPGFSDGATKGDGTGSAAIRISSTGPVVALAGWSAVRVDQIEALDWRGWIESEPRWRIAGTTVLREQHGRLRRASRKENR